MREDEHNQCELEAQERIEADPEYRAGFNKWLDSLERRDEHELDETLKDMEKKHGNNSKR
jgi:hypothetical protein